MKKYTLTGFQALNHVPEKPELTAKRISSNSLCFDMTYQVWPNRAALAKSIRMQQKRASKQTDWMPIVPLKNGEGL